MGTALALRGRQGVGKTIVGKIVGSLLGAATRRSRLWARRPGRPASHQAEAAKRGQKIVADHTGIVLRWSICVSSLKPALSAPDTV